MAKIVVIDDNAAIIELIKINLEIQGHTVKTALNGIAGLALIQQERPNLILLDLMMPEVDGYTVCQRIRKDAVVGNTPILMLTALGQVQDKVKGFDVGADDYLTKPFELPELLVRVRALLRRSNALPESLQKGEIRTVGHFILMPDNLEISIQGQLIKLTPTEFEIMYCLVQNYGKTISLGTLLKEVWGYQPDDDVETIRVHVRHLRAKFEKAKLPATYIETIYGGGYRLWPEGKPAEATSEVAE
jgi:two-component system response regulator RpaA